jgi:ABC-type cobalamin transport system permease subunit
MALRLLVLAGIFLLGYLEHLTLGKRDVVCVTWFWGLAGLVVWVVYPLTTLRICAGSAVLVSGLFLLALYYKRLARAKTPKSTD